MIITNTKIAEKFIYKLFYNKIRIKKIFFIIGQNTMFVGGVHVFICEKCYGMSGRSIPLHCRRETRVYISTTFGNHTYF